MDKLNALFQQLGRMQWSDYLDIILVAFLIYKLLPVIRTTGTVKIAGVIAAIAWSSEKAAGETEEPTAVTEETQTTEEHEIEIVEEEEEEEKEEPVIQIVGEEKEEEEELPETLTGTTAPEETTEATPTNTEEVTTIAPSSAEKNTSAESKKEVSWGMVSLIALGGAGCGIGAAILLIKKKP